MFPFMKLGYQKDSSIFNWTENQTCFIKETFSDDAIEKLYFMEEQRSLFLECNLFWRYNSSKDQSWSSVFIEEKKILNDTFLLCKKSEASILNLCFHWREKESVSWMKCFLPTHKSRKQISKLPFHWREKSLFREWEFFYQCKSQKGHSWSCIFIEEKRACFLNDTFFDDAKVFIHP